MNIATVLSWRYFTYLISSVCRSNGFYRENLNLSLSPCSEIIAFISAAFAIALGTTIALSTLTRYNFLNTQHTNILSPHKFFSSGIFTFSMLIICKCIVYLLLRWFVILLLKTEGLKLRVFFLIKETGRFWSNIWIIRLRFNEKSHSKFNEKSLMIDRLEETL